MKEPILDAPFRDAITDFLDTKETILWEGEPQLFAQLNKNEPLYFGFSKNDLQHHLGYLFLAIFVVFVLVLLKSTPVAGLVFVITLFLSLGIYNFYYKKPFQNIKYALTPKKVIFSFSLAGTQQTKFHFISLEDISKVDFAMEPDLENVGTIFLYLKNPNNKPFTTHNVRHGGQRYQITMELIDHPQTVMHLIRKEMKT